jgi:hypothetical protein
MDVPPQKVEDSSVLANEDAISLMQNMGLVVTLGMMVVKILSSKSM